MKHQHLSNAVLFPIFIGAAIGLFFAWPEKLEWKGWAYPDQNSLAADIPLGSFESLEKCQEAARMVLRYTNEIRQLDGDHLVGDDECGYRCKPNSSMGGINVCKTTAR